MKKSIATIVAFGMLAAMADMTVDSDLSLTGDLDWRGQGKVTIAENVTVDLAGHTLKLADLAGEGTIADSSAGDGGTLEMEIANGVNVVNPGIALAGNLKLVKSGAGTLTLAKNEQTFIGGTYVNAGKLQVANPGVNDITHHGRLSPVGPEHSLVRVASGAIFNPGGNCNFNWYHIVLDGGTLANCADGFDMTLPTRESISDIELTADSTFLGDYSMVFGQTAKTVLNGHTFTFNIANGKTVWWSNIVAENGKVRLLSSGNGQFQTSQSAIDWSTVDVEATAVLNLGQKWTVRNYTALRTADGNGGSAEMCVKGVFTPTTDYFYGCMMQDGSTIDLSQKSGIWSITSAFTGGRKVVGFANNATVTIDLHGRTLAAGDQVVAWSDNIPANLSGLTFQPDAATAAGGVSLAVNASGVFIDGANLVADAWWTGAEDNSVLKPANWLCKNGAGEVVENGLPIAATTIHFSGSVAFSFVEGESLTCPVLVFENGCKLAADVDWSPLVCNSMQGTLDLNGHSCRLAGLNGNATFTSSKMTQSITGKYFKFVSTKRINSPHFELNYLALYAADGTVQSDGITTDTTITDAAELAPGKCCTKDMATMGRKSNYGYKNTELVDNIFNPNASVKWCVGYLDGGSTEPITVCFRLRDDAKPIVGYNLATSKDNAADQNRRGIAWELYASDNGRDWRLVDSRDYAANQTPSTNNTMYSPTPYSLYSLGADDLAQLYFSVPENTTVNNTTVTLAGGVRLVKEGPGTFIATKTQQSYAGGTEVVEGTLKMGTLGNVSILGKAASDVTICSNAVVDINGNYNNTSYHYVFKGGALAFFGGLTGNDFFGDYEVLAEGSVLAFANVNTQSARFTLHGHTLEASVARLRGATVVVDEGTLDYYCRFYVAGGSFTASNATVVANAMYQFTGTAVLGGYVEKSTEESTAGSVANLAQIIGTFKPDTDYFYAYKINDGVTLDLTGRTTPMPVKSACKANNTLTFVDGATITLDLTGSALCRCGKVVTWEVGAAPANLDTLTFNLEIGRRPIPYRTQVREDGVYLISNATVIFVR